MAIKTEKEVEVNSQGEIFPPKEAITFKGIENICEREAPKDTEVRWPEGEKEPRESCVLEAERREWPTESCPAEAPNSVQLSKKRRKNHCIKRSE